MKAARTLSIVLMPVWLIACVTINVYFPAAAAEKAADRFIQDVYGKQPPTKNPQQKAPKAQPQSEAAPGRGLLIHALNSLVTPARAAENIDINTPSIQRIKRSMAARNSALRPYYNSGAIGLTDSGLIAIRNLGAVPLAQRNRLKQLVAADNRDRNALYPEIARANGHPEWEQRIRRIWAQRWIANAPKGWWYQNNQGNWTRK